jgi:alkylation response protein AidB-like acyl-CoA dehydrogenase
MPFHAPVNDLRFILDHVAGFDRVAATVRFADATPDTVTAILTEAGRFAEGVMAPLNRAGDKHPARLENGVVRTTPGFAEAYRALADGGWIGLAADPAHGGMGLPQTLATCVTDMFSGANLALQLNPLLSIGQIEALEHHASDTLKALYLPKLISGEWQGTMNLTEPQAGSDVGALTSRAEPQSDGTYAVTGQKIYITSAIWCWRVCRMRPKDRRGSACSLCRNSCPMRRATPARATACRWCRWSISWACTAARPA